MASPSETARVVVDLASARAPTLARGRLVCVDGPAGSGKTTLAAEIATLVEGARVVHMDDLYEGWSGIEHAITAQLDSVLLPLAAGRTGSYRRYDWAGHRFAETREVPPGPMLVVEGVGSGTAAHTPLRTVLVWVEAPRELRVSRGLAWGATLDQWRAWELSERIVFEREDTRAAADVLVDGTGDRAPLLT